MKELILATNNKRKVCEIKDILKGIEVLSLDDIKLDIEIEEDKDTFEGNALKKARTISEIAKKPCIADDSGLCIEYLNGFPGVKTARFLGENATNEEKNNYLIEKLKGIPKEKRKAKFVCCIALVIPGEEEKTFVGELDGYIAENSRGDNGFAQDPIFEIEDGRTLGELKIEDKNKISHRYKALQKLREYIISEK